MYNESHSRSSYETWMMWTHSFVVDAQKKSSRRVRPLRPARVRVGGGGLLGQSRGRLTGGDERRKLVGRRSETAEEERRRCPQPETRRLVATEIEKGCQLYAFTQRGNCRGEKAEKMSSAGGRGARARTHICRGAHANATLSVYCLGTQGGPRGKKEVMDG